MGDTGFFRLSAALCIVAVVGLSGCARPIGDFGRAADDVFHDQAMPAIGSLRASISGEPVSSFNLTDQEREMRDRVWRYLVAPHASDWFYDTAIELERTRVAPSATFRFKSNLYYLWLTRERFASSRVRYNRIGDDVAADIATMPAVFRAICAVQGIDRQRRVAGDGIEQLDPAMRQEAADREAENKMTIGWFVRSVGYRYDSYSYALDHLLIETPHEEAVATDTALSEMAIYVEAADRGDFCTGSFSAAGTETQQTIHSRYPISGENEGPYRK